MQRTAVRRVSQDNLSSGARSVGGARSDTPTKRTSAAIGRASGPPGAGAGGLSTSWSSTAPSNKYHNGDGVTFAAGPAGRSVVRPADPSARPAAGTSLSKKVYAPAPEDRPILVLDMDETLIHTVFHPSGHRVLHRPGLYQFLDAMVKLYQLVIFTAGLPQYADVVLDEIDPTGKYFCQRHYRNSCKVMNGIYCKDLRNIRKSLKNILIIDNIPQNSMLQNDLGIPIEDYLGDQSDTALIDLIPLLKGLAESKLEVGPYLKRNMKSIRHVLQDGFYQL
jgi:Dullard-like phosphatase family protein